MTDIDAERRIHQLEEQLRNARDDALEEAARRLEGMEDPFADDRGDYAWCARLLREMKGTPA